MLVQTNHEEYRDYCEGVNQLVVPSDHLPLLPPVAAIVRGYLEPLFNSMVVQSPPDRSAALPLGVVRDSRVRSRIYFAPLMYPYAFPPSHKPCTTAMVYTPLNVERRDSPLLRVDYFGIADAQTRQSYEYRQAEDHLVRFAWYSSVVAASTDPSYSLLFLVVRTTHEDRTFSIECPVYQLKRDGAPLRIHTLQYDHPIPRNSDLSISASTNAVTLLHHTWRQQLRLTVWDLDTLRQVTTITTTPLAQGDHLVAMSTSSIFVVQSSAGQYLSTRFDFDPPPAADPGQATAPDAAIVTDK